MSLRSLALTTAKKALQRLMKTGWGLKWTRLISVEHEQFVAGQVALRHRDSIAERLESRVVRGPFRGMRYPREVQANAFIAKLLGAYEAELHPSIEEICRQSYRTLINVGAAEGYYSVGLAMRLPGLKVYGFEAEAAPRGELQRLARLNGVAERIEIDGFCTHAALSKFPLGPDTLILMDCEGCEWHVLDPVRVPRLQGCDILVELHRVRDNQPRALIQRAFDSSHTIEWIEARHRDTSEFPELSELRQFEREALLQERAANHEGWAYLRRKLD